MYNSQLVVQTLSVEDIFLDPNNPRFWSESTNRDVPDKKIIDVKVQATAKSNIDKHGIDDLVNSILRNGFLLLDRLVVRPIRDVKGKFVVVEGNRRFRSLTKLRDLIASGSISEEGIGEEYLQNLKSSTDSIEVLVYNGTGTSDISWLLQGIRHISGIKDWEPAQRAKLVAKQIDEEGQTFRSAGQQFGLSPQAVGRLYRTYKALEQMRSDEDYGGRVRNDYFSLFEEVNRSGTLREWFGWNDKTKTYDNADRIKRFYSWITPDDEHPDHARRIHNPRHIKELASLVDSNSKSLLSEVERHEIGISEAFSQATGQAKPKDWKKAVAAARAIINDLPQSAMFEETEIFLSELQGLSDAISQRMTAAKAL